MTGTITKTASAVSACVLSLCHHDDSPNFPGGARLVIDLDHQVQINGPCASILLQCKWRSVRRELVDVLDALVSDIVVVYPSP